MNEIHVDRCRKRFAGKDNVQVMVNSGYDFQPVERDSVTAVFSYDSVVHFDIFDIYSYLADANRILIKGGRLLFHHSNYIGSPGRHYLKNPHLRNFMSAEIFAHFAIKAGFRIISQEIMDWGGIKNLDCLSLCEKI